MPSASVTRTFAATSPASPRASQSALPISRAISSASASLRSAASAPKRRITAARGVEAGVAPGGERVGGPCDGGVDLGRAGDREAADLVVRIGGGGADQLLGGGHGSSARGALRAAASR